MLPLSSSLFMAIQHALMRRSLSAACTRSTCSCRVEFGLEFVTVTDPRRAPCADVDNVPSYHPFCVRAARRYPSGVQSVMKRLAKRLGKVTGSDQHNFECVEIHVTRPGTDLKQQHV